MELPIWDSWFNSPDSEENRSPRHSSTLDSLIDAKSEINSILIELELKELNPSEISFLYYQHMERTLNEHKKISKEDRWPLKDQRRIQKAANKASAICSWIKRNQKKNNLTPEELFERLDEITNLLRQFCR